MKRKVLAMALISAMAVSSFTACGGTDDKGDAKGTEKTEAPAEKPAPPAEKQDVALTMWGAEEDQAMLQKMVDEFKEEYKDYANFDIQLGVESESTAKDTVLKDPTAAADVYAFASDQLPDLVKADALLALDEVEEAVKTYAGKTLDDIKSANTSGSVDAATSDGKLYAFPMSADNGYFLYYDKNAVSSEQAQSWDGILEAAKAAGKKAGMTLASGWYNAGFFYGAGFTTGLNEDGTTTCDWNGTSEDGYTGVQVVQAMNAIASNEAFMGIADGDISNQIAAGSLCAVVSGTWDATAAQDAFGDGYAATKLPTFTCNGNQLQMGSAAGFKLVAVNKYSKQAGWAALLGEWITNETNQNTRFAEREIGPSNINAASTDAVSQNIAIAGLSEQSPYGIVQLVGGNFWDPTATFGQKVAAGDFAKADDSTIQAALDEMVKGVTAAVE